MDYNFNDSLRRVFAHEGGYTNHPSDPGGPTNWGITIHDARAYWKRDASADDVSAMPKDVAKRIYKSKYWDAMRCDELPSGVDYAVFDFGVNSGVSRSLKFLERIAGVPEDGKPDDTLIRTVAHLPPKTVITELCNRRLAFLKGLKTWPVFGKGWGRRVSEVRADAMKMADLTPLPAPRANNETTAKTDRPDNATKPALGSSEIWSQLLAIITSVASVVTDIRFLVLIVVLFCAYQIWRRYQRGDLSGWFQ